MQRLKVSESHLEQLFGTRDEHLRYLEERLGIKVNARGVEVQLSGDEVAETTLLEVFTAAVRSWEDPGRFRQAKVV